MKIRKKMLEWSELEDFNGYLQENILTTCEM